MSQANPENILCTHPNQYPRFETDVVPGTNWEIEQYSPNQFYAYLWTQDSHQMSYILDEDGFDKVFTSRDAALKAIRSIEQAEKETQTA